MHPGSIPGEASNHPSDLSAMEWHTFVAAYKRIILRACKRLKENRFACFVVGDFRCTKGFYRNFVSETIHGFEACGVRLYNEAILVTAVGSGAMRVTRQFNGGRKLVKTHQNVLVFCKGDPRLATRAISSENESSDGAAGSRAFRHAAGYRVGVRWAWTAHVAVAADHDAGAGGGW